MPGGSTPLLAVPNVSEGRDLALVGRLGHAFARDATLLDTHADEVHNRSVFTLSSDAGSVVEALEAGARETIAAIDLTRHTGQHPRVGALDVAPVVYLNREARANAEAQALEVADRIAELEVPVFLYGALASIPQRRERAYFRRGGLELLGERMRSGELAPDRGPDEPHPTAGVTLVTARPPLAAFNMEWEGMTLTQAREVAASLRESGGGRLGVRAIAIALANDVTQISTNIHDPIALPLREVVATARELARPHAGEIVGAEIVGLVPRGAIEGFPKDVPLPGFDPAQTVIEERLARLAAE